jgi:hypothetical protein
VVAAQPEVMWQSTAVLGQQWCASRRSVKHTCAAVCCCIVGGIPQYSAVTPAAVTRGNCACDSSSCSLCCCTDDVMLRTYEAAVVLCDVRVAQL